MSEQVNPNMIKYGLIAGGVLFILLGVLVVALGGVGPNITYALFFLMVGIGFFVVLDMRKNETPGYRSRVLDDEGAEEGAEESAPAAAAPGDEPGWSPPGNGGGGERMSHLDAADYLFDKICAASTPDTVGMLVREMVQDLQQKGYSDKGLAEFRGRLSQRLGAISEEGSEPGLLANRREAQKFLGTQG